MNKSAQSSWSRKGVFSILTLAIVIALVTMVIPGRTSAQEKPTLVISVWGGTYAEEFQEYVADPFAEEYGVDVVIVGGGSSDRLARLLATVDNPEADLFYITDYQGAIAKEAGALQPIRPENFENLDSLYEIARDPLGDNTCPSFTILSVGIAYNVDFFEEPPTSWEDLWRDDLDADVGYPNMATSYAPLLLIKLAELNGGGIDDVDSGFEVIAEHKDRLFLYTLQEGLQAVIQGDAALTPQLNIFVVRDPALPIDFIIPEEGGLGVTNLACVVNGTQQRDLAEKFIDFHLAVEQQLAMAVNQGESPTNAEVEVPEDLPYYLVVGEDAVNELDFYDPNEVAANRDEWIERWQEEIIAE